MSALTLRDIRAAIDASEATLHEARRENAVLRKEIAMLRSDYAILLERWKEATAAAQCSDELRRCTPLEPDGPSDSYLVTEHRLPGAYCDGTHKGAPCDDPGCHVWAEQVRAVNRVNDPTSAAS